VIFLKNDPLRFLHPQQTHAHLIHLDKLNQAMRGTLAEHLGIEFIEASDDHLTAMMPINSCVKQPMGLLHGGASAALAETVGSAAANLCVSQKEKACVGLEININHLRPMKSGQVIAVAKPLHLGRTTHVWEIKISNEEGRLVAIARHTVAVIDKKKFET